MVLRSSAVKFFRFGDGFFKSVQSVKICIKKKVGGLCALSRITKIRGGDGLFRLSVFICVYLRLNFLGVGGGFQTLTKHYINSIIIPWNSYLLRVHRDERCSSSSWDSNSLRWLRG